MADNIKNISTGYVVKHGTFTQAASSAGWRNITFDTGLSSVEYCIVRGRYASNGYYGASFKDGFTANGGVVTVKMAFISGQDHFIEWLACGS